MKTTISIAIATHDRPQCLRRAIDSIVAQEHKPLEIIVVNDGADEIDASLGDLCQSSGIPFIVERRHTPCLPASRNCAIDRASADVVLLLDDDCYLRSDYIARLASLYDADEEELVAAILTDDDQFKPEGHTHIGLQNVDRRIRMYYGEENPVTITSKPGEGTSVTICIPMQESGALHTMHANAQN